MMNCHAILSRLPNIPDSSTPIGANEEENVFYRDWGEKPFLILIQNNILKLVKMLI